MKRSSVVVVAFAAIGTFVSIFKASLYAIDLKAKLKDTVEEFVRVAGTTTR